MRWRVALRAVAVGVASSALAYVAAVASLQRQLLFPRPAASGAPPPPADVRKVWLASADGAVEAWYLPPERRSAARAPLLVFFHGNGELIDFVADEFSEPRGWGMGLLLVEFPGYGRSAGTPSQASISEVALAAGDWARQRDDLDAERIVAYGRSLGGAAAAILATQRPMAALVLESTFTSVRSFAHDFWVPELIVRDPFDTLTLLQSYSRPLLVIHGERDRVVPIDHGRRLSRAVRGSQLKVLGCGHNDCERPWQVVREFLVEADVVREQAVLPTIVY